VWGSGPDDVWVVGDRGRLLRWRNGALAAVDSGTTKDLRGVWGSGPDDVWIAGLGVLMHATAAGPSPPLPEFMGHIFYRVRGTSPRDVWVAGSGPYHFDGMTWNRVDTGAALGPRDVWPVSADEVWTAGSKELRQWTRARGTWVKYDARTDDVLWASGSDDVWAASFYGITHFDGARWSAEMRPESDQYEALWGSARGDVWAAGSGGALAHRSSGGVWASKPREQRFTNNWLSDIWGLGPGDIWMVGDAGTILRRRK
jgi:hypothetical protein